MPELPIVKQENNEPVGATVEEIEEFIEIPVPEIPIVKQDNDESVGAPDGKIFEDRFMEQVENLAPVRERRLLQRFRDEDYRVADSLTSEVDEPKSVDEALNSKHTAEWHEL